MDTMKNAAYQASAALAKERGSFPLYDKKRWGKNPLVASLRPGVKSAISRNGIRNGVLLTVAPTGTTSLFAGNVSSGLEPVFLNTIHRKVRQDDGTTKTHILQDYNVHLYKAVHGEDAKLPEYFVEHSDLTVDDHLTIQAIIQDHIDASVSKTINIPESMSQKDFGNVYLQAYAMGCKGCTTYRPSDVRGSVLSAGETQVQNASNELTVRPAALKGTTYKLKWLSGEESYYLTVNEDELGIPREVFINSTSSKYTDWTTALCLMISAVLRRGGTIDFLPEELKKVHSINDAGFVQGKYYGSLVALIGEVLGEHFTHHYSSGVESVAPKTLSDTHDPEYTGVVCPDCGAPSMTPKEGCMTCMNCGYSKCG